MKKQSYIPKGAMLQLDKITMSANPLAKTAKTTAYPKLGDGTLVNVTTDPRKAEYYIAHLIDPTNPFAMSRTKTVLQSGGDGAKVKPTWRVADPVRMATFIGKAIPAAIVTRFVEEYVIAGNVKQMDTYTMVIFQGEIIEHEFARAGHAIVGVDVDIKAEEVIVNEAGSANMMN
jgi:hypothetical protein